MRKLLLILVLVSSSVVAQINCKPVRMNDPVITITPSLANGIAVEIFLSEIERISPSYLKHGGTLKVQIIGDDTNWIVIKALDQDLVRQKFNKGWR